MLIQKCVLMNGVYSVFTSLDIVVTCKYRRPYSIASTLFTDTNLEHTLENEIIFNNIILLAKKFWGGSTVLHLRKNDV